MHLMTALIYCGSREVLIINHILELELIKNNLVPIGKWFLLFLDVLLTL